METTPDFEALRARRNAAMQDMHQKMADEWGVPLTDLEIQQIAIATKSAEPGRDGYVLPFSFARAIEQAHNIKGKPK